MDNSGEQHSILLKDRSALESGDNNVTRYQEVQLVPVTNDDILSNTLHRPTQTVQLTQASRNSNHTLQLLPIPTEQPQPKRRMRFSSSLDIQLLKAVISTDAHLSDHGEAKTKFTEALHIFKEGLTASISENGHALPSWKSLNDRFKKLNADHRIAMARNLTATSIIEVRGERELLLDEIMHAVDEHDVNRRCERDERSQLDERLSVSGEEIRDSAMNPRRGSNDVTPTRKQFSAQDSDDDDSERFAEHVRTQHESEEKRLKLETKSLLLEKTRAKKEAKNEEREARKDQLEYERVNLMEALQERRLNLDTQRFKMDRKRLDLEKEERMAAIAKNKCSY